MSGVTAFLLTVAAMAGLFAAEAKNCHIARDDDTNIYCITYTRTMVAMEPRTMERRRPPHRVGQ
jgi:hypothetical protein